MFGKIFRWSLLFISMVLLQTTIVPYLAIAGTIKPDLILITLFVLAMEYGRMGGIWGGFFVGLLLDVYAPGHFGGQALAYTVTGAFVGFFERKKLATEPSLQLLLILLASLLMNSVYHITTQGLEVMGTTPYFRAFISSFLPNGVYTTIIAAVVLFFRFYVSPTRSR